MIDEKALDLTNLTEQLNSVVELKGKGLDYEEVVGDHDHDHSHEEL